MKLSHDFKESIKTALAMTIAYGVGLQMGWDRPYWAGFAVAFISLATVGQSLNKGVLRMVGTVMAAIVALTLIGLFSQQRWLFMLFLSLWFAFCTYMNGGTRHQYFWFVGAFVALIIAGDGGPNAQNAFTIAALRLQQTGLGVLTYSLVAILLWPNNSKKALEAIARSLAAAQQDTFAASMAFLRDESQAEALKETRAAEISALPQLAQLLDAAITDSDDIREMQAPWRHYQQASATFAETAMRWRENFSELRGIAQPEVLPGLSAFELELEHRLGGICAMMDHGASPPECTEPDLTIDQDALRQLSHFQRAAVLVARHHMRKLDALSRLMCNSASAMCGLEEAASVEAPDAVPRRPWVPDPERLLAATKIMLVLWVAFLAVIYIPDFPGGTGFVIMCGPLGMVLLCTPQIPVKALFAPAANSIIFAGLLYVFVMPRLSSFMELGLMIFIATFIICFRYSSPTAALGRALGLAMLVNLISVSNQQSYNFLSVANTALMFPLLFLLLAIISHIPHSPRPERAILRLMGRYFRSAEYLLSQPATGDRSALGLRRDAFHRQELASLPGKMQSWLTTVNPAVLGTATPEQLSTMLNRLQALSYRVEELLEVRPLPQSSHLKAALQDDMRTWHQKVIETMHNTGSNPGEEIPHAQARLDERLAKVERGIRQIVNSDSGISLQPAEEQNFYRLLAAYRGTSEALLDFTRQAAKVDWVPFYEERFT